MSAKTKIIKPVPPTKQEMQIADDILARYAAAHPERNKRLAQLDRKERGKVAALKNKSSRLSYQMQDLILEEYPELEKLLMWLLEINPYVWIIGDEYSYETALCEYEKAKKAYIEARSARAQRQLVEVRAKRKDKATREANVERLLEKVLQKFDDDDQSGVTA